MKTTNIIIGDEQNRLNRICQAVFRRAYPGMSVHCTLVTFIGEFIAAASEPHTHLAMFITGGNLNQGSGDPVPTRQMDAAGIVRSIKTQRSIPVIVASVEQDAREAVLAAGADAFLDLPIHPQQIADAIARCLGLEPKIIISRPFNIFRN